MVGGDRVYEVGAELQPAAFRGDRQVDGGDTVGWPGDGEDAEQASAVLEGSERQPDPLLGEGGGVPGEEEPGLGFGELADVGAREGVTPVRGLMGGGGGVLGFQDRTPAGDGSTTLLHALVSAKFVR